ncbi:hypothetical protein OP256_001306 [Vibrio parahaemolyticus]|nr:hypothetical protein [Vibrio parahaemolyticus]
MINFRSNKFHGEHEPNAKREKKWLERVARYAEQHGSFPERSNGAFDLHHVKGRTFSHKKIHLGRWMVLPIEQDFHAVMSNNPLNVTHYKSRYEEAYGTQVGQFLEMCDQIEQEDGALPFDEAVLQAVMDL